LALQATTRGRRSTGGGCLLAAKGHAARTAVRDLAVLRVRPAFHSDAVPGAREAWHRCHFDRLPDAVPALGQVAELTHIGAAVRAAEGALDRARLRRHRGCTRVVASGAARSAAS